MRALCTLGKTMNKIIASLIVALTLSACGWHLRGSVTDDGASVFNAPLNAQIQSTDDHGPLMNVMRQLLHAYNINEVSTLNDKSYLLKLDEVKLEKRAAGVGNDALVNAYELILSVNYQISNSTQVLTNADTRGSISRTYNFDVNQANTSEQEEALILREMHRDLAQQILRRLKILSTQKANKADVKREAAIEPAPTAQPAN